MIVLNHIFKLINQMFTSIQYCRLTLKTNIVKKKPKAQNNEKFVCMIEIKRQIELRIISKNKCGIVFQLVKQMLFSFNLSQYLMLPEELCF